MSGMIVIWERNKPATKREDIIAWDVSSRTFKHAVEDIMAELQMNRPDLAEVLRRGTEEYCGIDYIQLDETPINDVQEIYEATLRVRPRIVERIPIEQRPDLWQAHLGGFDDLIALLKSGIERARQQDLKTSAASAEDG